LTALSPHHVLGGGGAWYVLEGETALAGNDGVGALWEKRRVRGSERRRREQGPEIYEAAGNFSIRLAFYAW